MKDIRIGHGYDVHRFKEGRKLIMGGVDIPYTHGLDGHSDADVLLHAIADSLLGALALGDIGKHFPDTDDRYAGADSIVLLKAVYDLVQSKGYFISNVDATVIAQVPKLAPYIDTMKNRIASVLGVSSNRISIKATTEEKLGFTGRKEGISSKSICLLNKKIE